MMKFKIKHINQKLALIIVIVCGIMLLNACSSRLDPKENIYLSKKNSDTSTKTAKDESVSEMSVPANRNKTYSPPPAVAENEAVEESITTYEDISDYEVIESEAPANYSKTDKSSRVYRETKTKHPNYNQPGETFQKIKESGFKSTEQSPLSTFSIDVDNAAYANVRRYLTSYNQLPPKDAVRIEEMINYFDYDYDAPKDEHPFSVYTELGECPWSRDNQLVHIGIQGKKLDYENLKTSNLVFLIDASGSMSAQNKLPLLKKSFEKLLNELGDDDRVAIVAYAGAAGLVLPSTRASNKRRILSALNNLGAGGSTAGGAGIQLAYKIALENFISEGNNRIILATDGDFNVGTTNNNALVKLVEEKRDLGVYLTICGFGMGNYKDGKMEMISNAGNGNYFYIDNLREADKVFVKDMRANMFTLAKDVKIQVEFNPDNVKAYRLIGYENRRLANRDFNDDTKDAGELGAGHSVTALYEITPTEKSLRYNNESWFNGKSTELVHVKLRYKPEDKTKSILIDNKVVKNTERNFLSDKYKFSAAVAGFGLLLTESENISSNYTLDDVIDWAKPSKNDDTYKREFVDLVNKAADLMYTDNHSWRN